MNASQKIWAFIPKKRRHAARIMINQICEQASNTLHHINRVELFTENSAMARLRDILRGNKYKVWVVVLSTEIH